MPNGIDLILADHRAVETLFTSFDQHPDAALAAQAIDMLKTHDDAERAALYPLAAELLNNTESIDDMHNAHHTIRQHIIHTATLEGDALIAGVTQLRSIVDAHVTDEEQNLLPALQKAATEQQLETLGTRLLQAKQRGG